MSKSPKQMTLKRKLTQVLNVYSVENGSNTPDFILAQYLLDCLKAFDRAVNERTKSQVKPTSFKDAFLAAGDKSRKIVEQQVREENETEYIKGHPLEDYGNPNH